MTDPQAYLKPAQEILEKLLHFLQFDDAKVTATVDPSPDDPQIFFDVETADSGRLIGRTSSTLDALQFLLNRLLSRTDEVTPYCIVDTAGYRVRRREKLVSDAMAALEQVRASGRAWRLPPLNAMDRRVIHHALRDIPDVETYSEEEDRLGRKRLVIAPVVQQSNTIADEAAEPEDDFAPAAEDAEPTDDVPAPDLAPASEPPPAP
ncbi:MAG: KH domain-containing protein [Kiritimatiellae bacterium]|nr:KH domain-containing protein [Kiritimatiellia bacterium]